tara:strand:+ start:186 stop:1037 length:852 start_codon:yes stop_codon:yes gene_type:complete
MKRHTIEQLEAISSQVRRDILRMVHAVQSGHPGGSLGCADLLVALYFEIMEHDPSKTAQKDHFFLSNGHISPVFYSVLARSGYFGIDELSTFRKINSRLQGHPTTHEGLPGVNIASGSLGQGLSASIGTALSKDMNGETGKVFCLMGDGELQEGQVWEAAMFAPANKVKNLIAVVDVNGQQIDGPTDQVLPLLDLSKKFESFGWNVIQLDNGNTIKDLIHSLQKAVRLCTEGPVIILMKTKMGKGVDFMEDSHHWHGIAPSDSQLTDALSQLPETLGDYPIKL